MPLYRTIFVEIGERLRSQALAFLLRARLEGDAAQIEQRAYVRLDPRDLGSIAGPPKKWLSRSR